MEELLKKLHDKNGLSREEALNILGTITDYIKEKFPMIAGAVDNLFPISTSGNNPSPEGTKDRPKF